MPSFIPVTHTTMKKNDTQGTVEKTWQKTTTPGLYRHGPTGKFYSRYSLNGNRTFKGLDTSVLTVAKLKHAQRMAEIEKQRQSPDNTGDETKTLGDLAGIMEAQVAGASFASSTKSNYVVQMKRLKKYWLGDFCASLPASVTRPTVFALRARLVDDGYRPLVINQTLTVLNNLLIMARQRHLAVSDPFAERPPEPTIWLPKKTRRPVMPSRSDLERIFAAMLVLPETQGLAPGHINILKAGAKNANEHARFMAYTGARHQEANAATYEDISGDRIHLHGTKSESSNRWVPMTAALKELLAERGIGKGKILRCKSSLGALRRACIRAKLPVIRQHDLRHYFATMCIESGVDVPTVSRWLGHSDGGALVMKTYGHLRDEHSVREIAKVKF